MTKTASSADLFDPAPGFLAAAVEIQAALDIKERSRTSVLPWRGQFSPQLVEYFLTQYAGSRILDPFCGSGTVLYEAAAAGRSASGIDINPAAIMLASFAHYCRTSQRERISLAEHGRRHIQRALATYQGDIVGLDIGGKLPNDPYFVCYLLTLFGDKSEVALSKGLATLRQIESKLFALPNAKVELSSCLGDARYTDFPSGHFQLVVTSPPYINVFNYHQHYRPIVEALGDKPLRIAVAEIGSNRKHRQNRFMTVIQYCIDMADVFAEMWRVLVADGQAIFVVGRSSKVKGVSFLNADLISTIANRSGFFSLSSRQSRVFTNRFGEQIYEDVLVLQRSRQDRVVAVEEVGRSIGVEALIEALQNCTDAEIRSEIEDAYERRASITRSPRVI